MHFQKASGKLTGAYAGLEEDEEPTKKKRKVTRHVKPTVAARFKGVDAATVTKVRGAVYSTRHVNVAGRRVRVLLCPRVQCTWSREQPRKGVGSLSYVHNHRTTCQHSVRFQVSEILTGKEICVLSGTSKLSKNDVEKKIIEWGGSIVQNPGNCDLFCDLSARLHKKKRSLKSPNHHPRADETQPQIVNVKSSAPLATVERGRATQYVSCWRF